MSARRLQVILTNLPSESAYVTEVRNVTDLASVPDQEPGVFGPWGQQDFLLAGIFDRLGDLVFLQSDPSTATRYPRYPRPGVADNVRAISPEALAYLEYKREHRGADPPDGWEPEVV